LADLKNNSQEILKIAYKILDDKMGEDIKILDIRELSPLADYFIIVSGKNINHVKTLADELEDHLYNNGFQMINKEGYASGGWILLDFGLVVFHIFDKEMRNFYNLERLWRDAKLVSIEELNE